MTQRGLNRALLARQLLLERVDAPIPDVLERMGGLQAQNAPSMYIGLWTRMRAFERAALTRALEAREAVQGTLMRGTIHLVSRADYWPMALATRAITGPAWLRGNRDVDMDAAVKRLEDALRAGPLRRREVAALVGEQAARGIHLFTPLLRIPPSGTWERRRADLYAAPEAEIGPPHGSPRDGIELLVRRYLGAFGPGTAAQVANWIGLPAPSVAAVMDAMELEPVGDLLDLPGAPRPDPETPAPVRLLPTWDAVLLAHARRAGVLPEEHRSRIFHTKTPHSVGTVLVDGAVRGIWRPAGAGIELEFLERVDAATRREAREEADRLAAWLV